MFYKKLKFLSLSVILSIGLHTYLYATYSLYSDNLYRGYKDVEALEPLQITPGQKVLDVGAGNGKFTEFLQTKAGRDAVYALEPNAEYYKELSEKLESKFVKNLSLQEALKKFPEEYLHQFDVVTVLKYNIPAWEKEDFLTDISKTVVRDGVVYITSVEGCRIYLQPYAEGPYIMGCLRKIFKNIEVTQRKDRFDGIAYALITCKDPLIK